MKSLMITGYKNFELGIFKRDAEEAIYIKATLEKHIRQYIDEGLEWVIISGQLGTELWAGEVTSLLKEEGLPIKLAILEPFTEQSNNWKEANQIWYDEVLLSTDYHAYITERPYENPSQFELRDQFIIDHTDGALLLYDTEKPGSPQYFYERARLENEKSGYPLLLIDFYELQETVEEMNRSF